MSYKKHFNFLSKNDLDFVTKEVKNIFTSPLSTYKTNITHWKSNIVPNKQTVLLYQLSPKTTIYNLILKTCKEKLKKSPSFITVYYWTSGSYIPWHEDDHVSSAGTLYLNESWDLNWGGLYNCIIKEKIETITPTYNLLVEQFNRMPHSTTPTTDFAPIRTTIQMMFPFKNSFIQ